MNSLKLASSTEMIILHCWFFVFFAFLFRQLVSIRIKLKNSKGSLQFFPDDVLISILSRLPAESVLQCRRVCKRWRNLTSNPDFIELQHKMAKPLILVMFERSSYSNPFSLCTDKATMNLILSTDEPTRKLTMTPICRYLMYLRNEKELFQPALSDSYHGLILCSSFTSRSLSYRTDFICNPVTREKITLPDRQNMSVCGFFFHSLTGDHRVLYYYNKGDCFGYKIYSLKTNSLRDLSCISYDPPLLRNPKIANGSLHWFAGENSDNQKISRRGKLCANMILRFDMDSEVFDTVPHPGYGPCSGNHDYISGYDLQLLEAQGELCICYLPAKRPAVIGIWFLVDPTNKHWVRRYHINLQWGFRYYPFPDDRLHLRVQILGLCKDVLLLHWKRVGLFSHNFQEGTIHKIEVEGEPESDLFTTYEIDRYVIVYKESLVSLKDSWQVWKGKQVEGKKWNGMNLEKNIFSCLEVAFVRIKSIFLDCVNYMFKS